MGKKKRSKAMAAAAGTKADCAGISGKAPGGCEQRRVKREKTQDQQGKRPPLLRRLIAFGIDWYVGSVLIYLPVMAALHLLQAPMQTIPDLGQLDPLPAAIACLASVLVAVCYYVVVPLRLNGSTLGKKLCGLRIASKGGGEVSMTALVARQVLGTMIVEGSLIAVTALALQVLFRSAPGARQAIILVHYIVTGLSMLLLVVSRRRTAIHDIIAGTEVVLA